MAYRVTQADEEALLVALATSQEFFDNHGFIRLSDFDLPHCRFVYEVVTRFRSVHSMLPDAATLAAETAAAATGTSVLTYETVPSQDCMPAVADLLERVQAGTTASERARVQGYVADYLCEIRGRLASRLASERGLSSGEYMDLVSDVRQEIRAASGEAFDFSDGCESAVEELENPPLRVPTGIKVLDDATNGGLVPGEIGCLVSGSGVGKTTGMLNFAANVASIGYHVLFITLENSKALIRSRWQAIVGHYPMRLYNTPLSQWPKAERARWDLLVSGSCPLRGRMTILDGSNATFTTASVENAIRQWKARLARNGVADKGVAVYVDWLKMVDPTGTPGVSEKSRSDEPITMIVKEFGKIAKRENVVIWTAQQLNRGGQNKEIATPSDIADATGIQNYLDIGISFGRPAADADALRRQQRMDGSSGGVVSDTDRTLILGSFKSRNADIVGRKMTVYQSPSLRIWANREEYERMDAKIRRSTPEELYRLGRL